MEGLEQTAKLLQMIRERGFKPGDKLPSERDLALEFNMSRSALREGLIRLDTLRIIECRPKSGIYLQPYGAERSIEAMVLFAETNTPLWQLFVYDPTGVQLELTFHSAAERTPTPDIPLERLYRPRERWFQPPAYLQFSDTSGSDHGRP